MIDRSLPPSLEAIIISTLVELGYTSLNLNRTPIVRAFRQAYEAGLISSAQDIQHALYMLHRVARPDIAMAFNLTNPEALNALEARSLQLVKQLEEGTRTFMMDAFRSAFTELGPGSPEELTDAIYHNLTSDEQGAFSKSRVESIVHTEMNAVHSNARMEQMRAAGLQTKVWKAIQGVACDVCQENADLGPVPIGSDAFNSVFGPTDGPPGHPKVCHCSLSINMDELQDIANPPDYWDGGGDEVRSDAEKDGDGDKEGRSLLPPLDLHAIISDVKRSLEPYTPQSSQQPIIISQPKQSFTTIKEVVRDEDGRIVRIIETTEPVEELDGSNG